MSSLLTACLKRSKVSETNLKNALGALDLVGHLLVQHVDVALDLAHQCGLTWGLLRQQALFGGLFQRYTSALGRLV